MNEPGRFELLFAHADDGTPYLEGAGDDTAGGAARPVEAGSEDYLADLSARAGDLSRQRWALLYPDNRAGKRLSRELVELVEKRAEDQGAPALKIPVPPGMDAAEALAWRRHEFPEVYGGVELRRPRYLCLLGDLDGISPATQEALAVDGFPGRIVCDDEDGYGAYAEKILRCEERPTRYEEARLAFYAVRDGTRATEDGYHRLIAPCARSCQALREELPEELPAAAIETLGGAPDPDGFLEMAGEDRPGLFFTMSHGLGPPRRRPWDRASARQLQGAMSFGQEGALAPADVASRPFLPGSFWFYFACFGAGTPAHSAYHHWLSLLREGEVRGLGDLRAVLRGLSEGAGYTSGVAKAALGNPRGPLNVLGHVDLAWSTSYETPRGADGRPLRGGDRAARFADLLGRVLRGDRAGMVLMDLRRWLDDVGGEINAVYDRARAAGRDAATAADKRALGWLWMLRQDLAGYVLLGDPAARLPLAPAARPAGAGLFPGARATARRGRARGRRRGPRDLRGDAAALGAGLPGSRGALAALDED